MSKPLIRQKNDGRGLERDKYSIVVVLRPLLLARPSLTLQMTKKKLTMAFPPLMMTMVKEDAPFVLSPPSPPIVSK